MLKREFECLHMESHSAAPGVLLGHSQGTSLPGCGSSSRWWLSQSKADGGVQERHDGQPEFRLPSSPLTQDLDACTFKKVPLGTQQ